MDTHAACLWWMRAALAALLSALCALPAAAQPRAARREDALEKDLARINDLHEAQRAEVQRSFADAIREATRQRDRELAAIRERQIERLRDLLEEAQKAGNTALAQHIASQLDLLQGGINARPPDQPAPEAGDATGGQALPQAVDRNAAIRELTELEERLKQAQAEVSHLEALLAAHEHGLAQSIDPRRVRADLATARTQADQLARQASRLARVADGVSPAAHLFGHSFPGERVVFVVDVGPLSAGPMRVLRAELRTAIRSLMAHQQFAMIVCRGESAEVQHRRLRFADAGHLAEAAAFLDALEPGGSEPGALAAGVELALREALLLRDAEGQPADAVVLITGSTLPPTAAEAIRVLNRRAGAAGGDGAAVARSTLHVLMHAPGAARAHPAGPADHAQRVPEAMAAAYEVLVTPSRGRLLWVDLRPVSR